MSPAKVEAIPPALPIRRGMAKSRIGKVYLGTPYSGWPLPMMDLDAEVKRFESEFTKLAPVLEDIEFVDGGLVHSPNQLPALMETFKDVDGILVVHLSMGISSSLKKLLELNVPLMVFAPPFAGHEWHTFAPMQKQGDKIDILPSSDFSDLAVAIRPLRAISRLKKAKVLYLQGGEIDPEYAESIRSKFGTEIKTIYLPQLEELYKSMDETEARADAERWMKEAKKIVEPTKEQIIGASRMYLALVKLLEDEQADAVTINCLGMGLVQRGLEYPCLGFSRLSSMGLGGVCEADIKSTMTHLIFQYLTGKPGFISDPVVDLSNDTIIHAHCVSPIMMDGPTGEQCPYIIRNHHEDGKSVSLQVQMRLGQKITMARLIGNNVMLYSTGEIIDNPTVDRGCKTKITTQVKNAQKILGNYSCGLHRVIFYGDHYQDLRRFCWFKDIRIANEEEENMFDVPGLEWETYIHA
ncbi:MAG: hypothetical protein ABIH23_16210 [bacterium]